MSSGTLLLKMDAPVTSQGKPPTGDPGTGTGDKNKKGDPGWAKTLVDKMGVDTKKMGEFNKKFLRGQLGLNFSTGAILKQSQIFTSSIGVIFQLLGAMVDVMLAPLIPLIIPAMSAMSDFIPKLAKWSDDVLTPIVEWILQWVKSVAGSAINIAKDIWDISANIVDGVGLVYDWLSTVFDRNWIRVTGWITQFLIYLPGEIRGRILEGVAKVGKFFLGLFTKIPGYLWKAASFFIKVGFPFIGNAFVSVVNTILGLPKKILSGISGFIKQLFEKAAPLLAKVPFVGDKLASMATTISKVNLGTLAKNVAKGSKAVPFLGAVATLGFGAHETFTAFKKGGLDAAIATATKTVAATALAATGNTVASMLVDVGGSQVIQRTMYDTAQKATNGGSGWGTAVANTSPTNVHITNVNKEGTIQDEYTLSSYDNRVRKGSDGDMIMNEMGLG